MYNKLYVNIKHCVCIGTVWSKEILKQIETAKENKPNGKEEKQEEGS